MAGHHHDRTRQPVAVLPFAQQRNAVGAGHPDVQQHCVERLIGELCTGGLGMLGHADPVALVLEDVADQRTDVGLVVYNQDVRLRHGVVRDRCVGATV